MRVREVTLDVYWTITAPGISAGGRSDRRGEGVQGANVTITDTDLETAGTGVAVDGRQQH
jgi:hypothetical protein